MATLEAHSVLGPRAWYVVFGWCCCCFVCDSLQKCVTICQCGTAHRVSVECGTHMVKHFKRRRRRRHLPAAYMFSLRECRNDVLETREVNSAMEWALASPIYLCPAAAAAHAANTVFSPIIDVQQSLQASLAVNTVPRQRISTKPLITIWCEAILNVINPCQL
jgi:hypothetical protein